MMSYDQTHQQQNAYLPLIPNPPVERPLEIYARPEIRTGCIWEIQLRFSQQMRESHNLRHIYLEKPRANSARCPYLCLKVRSKLKVPVEELPLTKVAKIENDSDYLTLNEFSTITLKVRFTTRPRVVFQKQSDMMILIVSLKRGDQQICADESELIFRGGTGSIHSADSRKSNNNLVKNEVVHAPQQHIPMMSQQISHLGADLTTPMMHQQHPSYAPIPYEVPIHQQYNTGVPEMSNHGLNSCMSNNNGFSSGENVWSDFGTEFESTNYLGEPPIFGAGPEVWSQTPTQQQQQQQQQQQPASKPAPTFSDHQPSSHMKVLEMLQSIDRPEDMNPQDLSFLVSQSEFTIVHNKKRGFCCDCMSECLVYRGCGGPCGECGCFPSTHIDLDRPIDYNKKRLSTAQTPQPCKKQRTF